MLNPRLLCWLLLLAVAPPATSTPIAITGWAVDADGEPVAHASVRLIPLIGDYRFGSLLLEGKFEPEAAAECTTEGDGGFRLEAPEAGVFLVRIDARGFVPLDLRLQPLVEPMDLPTAELIHDAGTEVRILGPGHSPVAGARILARIEETPRRIRLSWQARWQVAQADAEGKVRISRGRDDSLKLYVHHPDFLEDQREQIRDSAVIVTLKRGRAQSIALRDHRGRSAAGVLVEVGEGRFPVGKTDPDGRLVITAVSTAEIPIEFAAQDQRRLVSTLRASDDEESSLRTFDLPAPTSVEGRVIDAVTREPLPGALVWKLDRNESLVRTDNVGGFRLTALTPGESQVQAAAAGYFHAFSKIVAVAGQHNQGPTLALEPASSVAGSVVDEDGRPLAAVEIVAAFQSRQNSRRGLGMRSGGTFRSDPKGRFRLRRLVPDAAYDLKLSKSGYAVGRESFTAPMPRQTAMVEVVLRRGRGGYGMVVDEDDVPLSGAEVTLERKEAGSVMRTISYGEPDEPDHRTMSDGDGRFEIADIAAGRFVLTAQAPGYAPTTVPGIEIPAGAGGVDLGTVVLSPGAAIQGRVLDVDGQPIAEVEIFAASHDPGRFGFSSLGAGPPDAVSALDGYFVVADRRVGEKVDLAARREGFTTARVSGVEAPTSEPVVLTLDPVSRLAGRVLDPDGDPIAGAYVNVFLERQGSTMAITATLGRAQTDAQGRFTVEELEPGTVSVTVTADGWQTAELVNIEIPRGRGVDDLEIRLRPGAVVTGNVRDPGGRPVVGARLTVTQEHRIGAFLAGATSDGDGNYRLSGVEPGRHTIRASHSEGGRATKTLEVTMGENRLDFVLGGGYDVSGQVVDMAGEPVQGARVRLRSGEGWWRGNEALTGNDGGFELKGVTDGAYTLSAEHPAYAAARVPETVEVRAQAVRGLLLRLTTGATIAGRLVGLEFDELAGCSVFAFSEGSASRVGEVDFEGRFQVTHMAPGQWHIGAETRSGRRAQRTVTLVEGDLEVAVDLDFRSGWTLSGWVVHERQPLDGATVTIRGTDLAASATSTTDHRGRFEFSNLEDGNYRIEVLELMSGLRQEEELEIVSDRELEIVIRTAAVIGRVIDVVDRAPLRGVRFEVRADRASLPGASLRAPLFPRAVSDEQGTFRLGGLAVGRWRIVAVKPGYAQAEKNVEIYLADDEVELEFELVPSAGLSFTVVGSHAATPSEVWVALLDHAGNRVAGGSYPVDVEGRVLAPTVPAGRWNLLVSARGTGTVELPVTAPEDRPRVVLEPSSGLAIAIPSLSEESRLAWAELTAADGRRVRTVSWGGEVRSRFEIHRGNGTIHGLPPGTWNVTVTAPDGHSWATSVAGVAGEITSVVLE